MCGVDGLASSAGGFAVFVAAVPIPASGGLLSVAVVVGGFEPVAELADDPLELGLEPAPVAGVPRHPPRGVVGIFGLHHAAGYRPHAPTSGRVHHVDQPPAVVEELCDLREARLDPPEPVGRLGGESLDLRLEGGGVLVVLLLLSLRDVRGPARLGGLALLLLAPHAFCLRPAHSDPPAECELECVLECVLLWSITRARGLTPLAPSGTRDPL